MDPELELDDLPDLHEPEPTEPEEPVKELTAVQKALKNKMRNVALTRVSKNKVTGFQNPGRNHNIRPRSR